MNIEDRRLTPGPIFTHFRKFQMTVCLKRIIRFTLCMYTDHTLSRTLD